MKLLVIVNVFHPDRAGGAAVFSDMCYALAERGMDVTVRCAYPYYPEWADKSGNNGFRIRRYDDQNVHIERFGLFIPGNPNSLVQRLLYEGSFLLSLLRSLHRGQAFDAVMVYCPLVGSVAFAVLNKWIHRKPLWLNVQDLSADAAAASGITKSSGVNSMLARIQNWFFNRTDVWSSISPVMIRRLEHIRRGGQTIHYLPNWLNASLAERIKALPSKQDRPPANPIRLLYAGNIGAKQGLLDFCRTLQATDVPFAFRVHGSGSGADAIRDWINQIGDARFSFGPFLDEAGFAQALHETDFFVITEKSGSGGSFIPSKMIPGMASGTPILAISDASTPLGEEMHDYKPGIWFGWDEVGNVPNLLTTLPIDSFQKWQHHALERAMFYDRDRIIDQLEEVLQTLATAS